MFLPDRPRHTPRDQRSLMDQDCITLAITMQCSSSTLQLCLGIFVLNVASLFASRAAIRSNFAAQLVSLSHGSSCKWGDLSTILYHVRSGDDIELNKNVIVSGQSNQSVDLRPLCNGVAEVGLPLDAILNFDYGHNIQAPKLEKTNKLRSIGAPHWRSCVHVGCGSGGLHADDVAANLRIRFAACSDGIDNDGDGLVDWPADPGCRNGKDESEAEPVSPNTDRSPAFSWAWNRSEGRLLWLNGTTTETETTLESADPLTNAWIIDESGAFPAASGPAKFWFHASDGGCRGPSSWCDWVLHPSQSNYSHVITESLKDMNISMLSLSDSVAVIRTVSPSLAVIDTVSLQDNRLYLTVNVTRPNSTNPVLDITVPVFLGSLAMGNRWTNGSIDSHVPGLWRMRPNFGGHNDSFNANSSAHWAVSYPGYAMSPVSVLSGPHRSMGAQWITPIEGPITSVLMDESVQQSKNLPGYFGSLSVTLKGGSTWAAASIVFDFGASTAPWHDRL